MCKVDFSHFGRKWFGIEEGTSKEYDLKRLWNKCKDSLKNTRIIKDEDMHFKYKEDSSSNASHPFPEGGYSNEILYSKMCSIEATMNHNHREHKL